METRKWVNPTLPQTLQIAVALFYLSAVFGLLFGAVFSLLGLALVAGSVGAGYGIANERRWGYGLGLGLSILAVLPAVYIAVHDGLFQLLALGNLLYFIFPVARLLLLVHPESRNYQRIWFK
jgi:hypothetical protein